MIDAAAYAKTVKLPAGADADSILKIRASEILRIVEIAYLTGAKDATEPLEKSTREMPEFMREIFGN